MRPNFIKAVARVKHPAWEPLTPALTRVITSDNILLCSLPAVIFAFCLGSMWRIFVCLLSDIGCAYRV